MGCRLGGVEFDVAASAGWYSGICGVLAGFALLAILLPLDHTSEEEADPRGVDAVVIFACAFFSLLILAFSYAVLSGRTGDGEEVGIAAHEQMLNGAALGLSTLLLLFALHAVLGTYGANRRVFEPARNVILAATAVAGPVVVLALQFSNALDLERYRIDRAGGVAMDCGPWNLPADVWINLGIVGAGLAAIAVLAALRGRLPRTPWAPRALAVAVLAYTVLVAAWASILLPLLSIDVTTSAVVEHVLLAGTAVATVGVATASWLGR